MPGSKTCTASASRATSPAEQIDQRTLVERMHDFKAHLWWLVRHFFRGQFTDEARDSFREQQGKLGKRSRVVGAAQFAQIPILNQSQLVARWKLETPPAMVSETQQLPIDGLERGRLPDRGHGRHVQGLHRRHRDQHCRGGATQQRARRELYVADRKTGAPMADADVALWADGQLQSSGKTDSDGLASLTMTVRGGAQGAEPENVWILARHGDDAALVTPWGYDFRRNGAAIGARLSSTPTGPSTARPHGPHQGHRAQGTERHAAASRSANRRRCTVNGPDNKVVLRKGFAGLARTEPSPPTSTSTSDAALGYYSISLAASSELAAAAASTWRSTRSPSTR